MYNRSLKRFEPSYGLYIYEDRNGYSRLILEKTKQRLQPIYTFSLLLEGQNLLRKLVREYRLCPKLCFIQRDNDPCIGLSHTLPAQSPTAKELLAWASADMHCAGACEQRESAGSYNKRVEEAIAALVRSLPSFTLVDEGRHAEEKSCILIEQGRLYGMGYLPADTAIGDMEELKGYLTRYPENDYMRGLIYQHAERWPAKKKDLRPVMQTAAQRVTEEDS
jgi:DNA polymerase-3 subunit epsilon